MNGVYESAVLTALEEHPNLDTILICTDNDEGGIDANDRLSDILREHGYERISRVLPRNKDWNEDLKAMNGVPFLPAVPHRRLEEYKNQVEDLQYYPCRIEKLRSQLGAAFKNGQYKYLAEYPGNKGIDLIEISIIQNAQLLANLMIQRFFIFQRCKKL